MGIPVSAERFELSTNGLKGRCSAIELRARAVQSERHSNMGNIHRQRDRRFTAKGAKFAKKNKRKIFAILAGFAVNSFEVRLLNPNASIRWRQND